MSWLKSLIRGRGGAGAHARPAALGFAGPQGTPLDELLGDATGAGEYRYAPSMVAWMQQQYELALYEADDYHTQARQALDCETQCRVRAADLKYWLRREAGIEFDTLHNGEYVSAGEQPAPEQPAPREQPAAEPARFDFTAAYAQQAPVAPQPDGQARAPLGEDAPLYGRHYGAGAGTRADVPRGAWASDAEPTAMTLVAYDAVVLGGGR